MTRTTFRGMVPVMRRKTRDLGVWIKFARLHDGAELAIVFHCTEAAQYRNGRAYDLTLHGTVDIRPEHVFYRVERFDGHGRIKYRYAGHDVMIAHKVFARNKQRLRRGWVSLWEVPPGKMLGRILQHHETSEVGVARLAAMRHQLTLASYTILH